jgi:sugar O-acyltransferase (sialic acid O-acetyltransferase NeuD family)
MKTLAIYGSGGLGREILNLARTINAESTVWGEIVFINDFVEGRTINNGASVYTFDEFRAKWGPPEATAVVAVGEPEIRAKLAEKLNAGGYELNAIIHPGSFIGANAEISDGAIICFGCFISCDVRIGRNALVQPNVAIGHDSIIGDNAVISSFVSIAGHVSIGEKAYIGMSVPIKEEATIGKQSIVSMGSVVIRDIPDGVIALGNPARAMKNNDNKRVFG